MTLTGFDFGTVDWTAVERVAHAGERGVAHWRTVQLGELRLREVEYGPGYLADHWCERGHVVFVLEGELITELKDGRTFVTRAGCSYHVATGREPHRSRTDRGAKLFIVD